MGNIIDPLNLTGFLNRQKCNPFFGRLLDFSTKKRCIARVKEGEERLSTRPEKPTKIRQKLNGCVFT